MSSSMLEQMDREVGSFTPEFEFLRGMYRFSGSQLPYFNLSLKVEHANAFIKLPRDVVFDPTHPIRLEELFQRELDEDRVEDKLVPYLKSANRLKFFNSITVAILPWDPNSRGRFLPSFPGPTSSREEGSMRHRELGPVRLSELSSGASSVGYISWNTDAAAAVVLDGQHRLHGLRKVAEDPEFRGRDKLLESRIPVIALVLHPDLGYQAPVAEDESSILSACRSVFIDLNKHSVRVAPDRQYLLDDLDIYAVAMRDIMGEEAGVTGGGSFSQRVSSTGRLPLALIDWYSGKAKFDNASASLHLTSTLVLYDHVVSSLSLPTFAGSDYEKSRKFVDGLSGRLDLPERDPELRKAIVRHFETCQEEEVPFSLREDHVASLGAHYRETIGQVVVRALTELVPYRALPQALEEHGILGGEFEAWMALDDVGKRAFPTSDDESPGVLIKPIVREVKATYPLAYQVVFQRAFVDVFVALDDASSELEEELDLEQPVITEMLSRFNTRVVPMLLVDGAGSGDEEPGYSGAWIGAGLRSNRNIDFTKASQGSIAGAVLAALLAPKDLRDHSDSEAGEWVADRIRRGTKASITDDLISKYGKNWKSRLQRAVRDEYLAREEDPPPSDVLENEAFVRAGRSLKMFLSGE